MQSAFTNICERMGKEKTEFDFGAILGSHCCIKSVCEIYSTINSMCCYWKVKLSLKVASYQSPVPEEHGVQKSPTLCQRRFKHPLVLTSAQNLYAGSFMVFFNV